MVGYNYSNGESSNGTISNCYATGDVSASTSTQTSYDISSYAGGLVGYNDSGTISNCYATGNVSSSSSSSSGASYAGGLAGYNYYIGTISGCYAMGNVSSSSSSSSGASYAGALVGYNDSGTISNCYRYSGQTFTVNENGTITSAATNTFGTAKSLADLQSVSFHAETLGWDSAVWNFTEGAYPTLKI